MKKDVKNHIMSEAMPLFYNYGIKAITMNELSIRLGISKRTIYEYFKDKNELIAECIKQYKCIADENLDEALAKAENVLDLFVFFLQEGMEQININVRFMDEIKRYHPKVYKELVVKHDQDGQKKFKQIIRLGIKQGIFRKDINIEVLNLFFKKGFSAVNNDIILKKRYTAGELLKNCLLPFVRGISSAKGLAIIDQKTEEIQKKSYQKQSKNKKNSK